MKTRGALADSVGYTLIEVVLFMAISGGLAAIAFIGLGPRLRNVRFTDATRSIQSDVAKEIMDSQAGVSRVADGVECVNQNGWFGGPYGQPLIQEQRDNVGGTSQACIINGKLAYFLKDKVEYHSIVSLRITTNPICKNAPDTFEIITQCYRPRIPRISQPLEKSLVQVVKNKNGLQISAQPNTDQFPSGFGYLQSPNSNNKFFFTFKGSMPATGFTDMDGIAATQFINGTDMSQDDPKNSIPIVSGTDKRVCLRLSGREAQLIFKPGAEEPALSTERCS